MKIFKLYILPVFLILMILSSCDKVIDLKLGDKTGELVIEGNMTNIQGPQVIKLSQNVPFSNTNTYPPVSGATVSVTDEAGTVLLFREGPLGTYTNSNSIGYTNKKYTLNVSVNNKSYTATSIMPEPVVLDTVTAENDEFNNGKNRKKITVHFHDPAGQPNQYNFLMFVNNVQVKRIFALDDQFIDGNDVSYDLRENDIDVYPGDTVRIDMQCVDRPMYTYWFTLMQQSPEGAGGGVTPSNPPTNINPTSLGYFSAHTTQSRTIMVK